MSWQSIPVFDSPRQEAVFVLFVVGSDFNESIGVRSCTTVCWLGDILVVRDFNWRILVYCFMKDDESLVLSSNLKGLPVQVVEHRCYAVLVRIFFCYKACPYKT